jgi:hypothetical protein
MVFGQSPTDRLDNKSANTDYIRDARFSSTLIFLDASISSINSFNSLIKKENYHNKITSFNNPTSSDLGFNLENEIQTALKPLLAKVKNTNTSKFSQVVSSLLGAQSQPSLMNAAITTMNPAFTTLIGLVGTLTIQEKKLTRQDLDSFIAATSKYFMQYEKLNLANTLFDQNVDRIISKLAELQFDLKEYMVDMITILHQVQRDELNKQNVEDLFLNYLDTHKLEKTPSRQDGKILNYPSDGIKNAKDIAYTLQKLFNEYQKVFADNYEQIRSILLESKTLGKNINSRQVDASIKDLEELYNETMNADMLGLRMTTLFERLKVLVATEQGAAVATR